MEIMTFMGRLLADVYFITTGTVAKAAEGEVVPIAYDPIHDEYSVTLSGKHFDILPYEFESIT